MKLARIILVLGFITMIGAVFAQITNDYRTIGSGAWTNTANWQKYNGTTWVAAAAFPTYTARGITIRNGHAMTVATNLSIDQTVIDSGGSVEVTAGILTFQGSGATANKLIGNLKLSGSGSINSGTTKLFIKSGGVYEHARNAGDYPLAAWEDGSTLLITGLTTTSPGNSGYSFYNVIWNCPSQTAIIENPATNSYHAVRGTLTVASTGTGSWRWGSSASSTKLIGNYEQSGGKVMMASSGACTQVTLNGDFVLSAGTLTTNPAAISCGWDFVKSGTQAFDKSGGTISEKIYFKVAAGTTLDIVDQPIIGGGVFTLDSGAGLIIRDADGITSSGATGAVQVTGTRDFNTGADYTYAGIVAQSSGNGLPVSVNNLTVDNAAGVSFTQAVTADGVFAQTNGVVSGSAISTDAYSSVDYKLLEIMEDENSISGFSVNTSLVASMPDRINREWTINGSFTGSKTVTFYWDETEDNNFDWDILVPAVYIGPSMYSPLDSDVYGNPRWVTVDIPSFEGATYSIGRNDGGTLPVELSSFTIATNFYNQVKLQWVTQSETNVNGFRIYRNTEDLLETAQLLSHFIPATNTSQMKVYIATDKEIYAEGIYYYWLENVDLNGESGFHGPIHINVVFANAPTPEVSFVQGVSNAYPNPFNPTVNIVCGMQKSGQTTVQIYNARGQLVKTLFAGTKAKGNFLLQWNGTDQYDRKLPSGIYLIRMDSDSGKSTRKVVLSE